MAWHKPLNKPRTPTTPKTPTFSSSAGLTINAATPKSPMGPPINSPATLKSPCESPSLGEVILGEEEDDGGEQEEERDDEPLEGEDLVGGPGSYAIDEEDEVCLRENLICISFFLYRTGSYPAKFRPLSSFDHRYMLYHLNSTIGIKCI